MIAIVYESSSVLCPHTNFLPYCLLFQTWDNRRSCLYAGNQNGGTVFEAADAHDPLIEGEYKNYITGGPFSTVFSFTQFDESRCGNS